MIEAELKKFEGGLEQAIETAKASKDVLSEQLGAQSGSLTEMQAELEAKKQELHTRKVTLADAAKAFQKTKAQTAERLAQRETGLAELVKAEASKSKVEALSA